MVNYNDNLVKVDGIFFSLSRLLMIIMANNMLQLRSTFDHVLYSSHIHSFNTHARA